MTEGLHEPVGPVGRRRQLRIGLAFGVLVGMAISLFIAFLTRQGFWSDHDWSVIARGDLLTLLIRGLTNTLQAAFAASILSLLGGVILVAGRLSKSQLVRGVFAGVIEVFRGLPLLLFIFALFLGLPYLGISLSAFWTLVLGLSLYNAPSMAEIYRSGIKSLPVGQEEAGLAVGLTRYQSLRYVLLPQAIRPMIPALLSQVTLVLKETALGFIIGFEDMVNLGRSSVEYLGLRSALPIYLLIAGVYIVLCLLLSACAAFAARRMQRSSRSVLKVADVAKGSGPGSTPMNPEEVPADTESRRSFQQ